MHPDHQSRLRPSRLLAAIAGVALAFPPSIHAQLSWSAYDETSLTPVASRPDGATVVTVPAGKRYTLVATNFLPIDFSAAAPAEVYVTINFKASGGLSSIAAGTRAVGFGLYNAGGTPTFADDNGYFTWLNGRNAGSLIELRRRNGDGTSTSLLNPTGSAYNSLGTGSKVFTSGSLSDGNSYSIQMHLMARNPGISFGNTSSSTSGAGIWVSGDGISQTAYTNPDNPPATKIFNEVGFMFYNSTASDVTLTINSISGLTAINPPSIVTQPASISVNPGQAGSLDVVAAGTPPLAYQWKKDGTAVSGATGPAYTVASAQASDAGNYTVTVTNSYGNATSGAAAVTVTSQPIPATITRQPASLTVNAGDNASFAVSAYGSSPLSYQWKKDGTPVSGGTGPALSLSGVAASDAGSYAVTVSNDAGSATSTAATLAVNTRPVFTTQPSGATVAVGATVTFTSAASGTPAPAYQWQHNGTAVAGATDATLTIASVAATDAGVYTVRAVNAVGATTSAGALLAIPSAMHATGFWPAGGATGVNTDTPLRVTFDQAPVVGNFGKIQIFRASDNAVVDTLDMGATPYTRMIGTQKVPYIFYPVIVTGNTAEIFPHAGVLAYGETYYVTVDPGVILDSSGATFTGITDPTAWQFTTKASGPDPDATALTVSADGTGDFTTVQGAIDFVPAGNSRRVVVTVMPGAYTEMVYVGKPFITVQGADRAQTVIQYADNNNFNTLTGNNRAMFSVDAPDFVLQTITLHNLTPKGGSQAEAFRANGIRILLNRVNLMSYQDTFLVNGSNCTAFVTDSYIEGDVDFMWGSGAVYFQHCELKVLNPGYYAQVRNGQNRFGHVYVDCRLTSAPGVTGSYLARIDPTPGNFPYSQVVYLDCAMGPQIDPAGWLLNNASSSSTVQFWEYHSTDLDGAALDVSRRISSSRQLSDAEAQLWRNPAYVLQGWVPKVAPTIDGAPVSQTVVSGSAVRLTVRANGSPEPSLQWYRNGVAIPGATSDTLVLPAAGAAAAGDYTVTAGNELGSVTSTAATLTVNPGAHAGEYFGTMGDSGTFALYVRNDGSGVLLGTNAPGYGTVVSRSVSVDSTGNVRATSGANVLLATIDGAGAMTGSFGPATGSTPATLKVTGARSSATGTAAGYAGDYELGAVGGSMTADMIVDASGAVVVVTRSAGVFDSGKGAVDASGQGAVTTGGGETVTVNLSAGGSAAATIASGSGTPASLSGMSDANAGSLRFGEFSARAKVGSGGNAAFLGFVITGNTPEEVLLRGVGPTLGQFGVGGVIPNPRIDLYKESSLIASNAGWFSSGYNSDLALATVETGAFPLSTTSADSALAVTLEPGSYTATMDSANGATSGVGLLELYEVSPVAGGPRLTNLSVRAEAGTGANTLIAGLDVAGSAPKRILIRGVGPGLAAFGVSDALAKPVLSLYSGSNVVARNTGWTTNSDAAAIAAATADIGTFPLASGSADSALLLNLTPGLYTIQVGSADGSTGSAMIEIYEVP